jgi:hypothetical protein
MGKMGCRDGSIPDPADVDDPVLAHWYRTAADGPAAVLKAVEARLDVLAGPYGPAMPDDVFWEHFRRAFADW